jgi:hypothetical protein
METNIYSLFILSSATSTFSLPELVARLVALSSIPKPFKLTGLVFIIAEAFDALQVLSAIFTRGVGAGSFAPHSLFASFSAVVSVLHTRKAVCTVCIAVTRGTACCFRRRPRRRLRRCCSGRCCFLGRGGRRCRWCRSGRHTDVIVAFQVTSAKLAFGILA